MIWKRLEDGWLIMNKKDYLVQVAKRLRIEAQQGHIEGYSPPDYDFVKSLIRAHDKDEISNRQGQKLKDILSKYHNQLEKIGANPRKISRIKFPVGDDVSVWFSKDDDGKMWMNIKSPYNEDFISDIKTIKAKMRKWDATSKIWKVRVTKNKKYVKKAIEFIEENYDEELDINIPDVKFGRVYFEGSEFHFDTNEYNKEFKKRVKNNIYTSRWDGDEWIIRPRNFDEIDEVVSLIEDFDVEVGENVLSQLMDIKERIKEEKERKQELYELSKQKSLESDYDVDLPSDDLELYPFQKYAVKILDLRKKGLLSDELGMGKTISILAHIYNHQELRPIIVICPSSVKINWKREIVKWTEAEEDDIYILSGQTGDIVEGKKFYLVNYAILHHRLDDLLKLDYEGLIADESHFVKESDSKRTESTLDLAEKVENTYLLTGTPMPNRPIELWTQLQALQPDEPDFQSLWGNDDGYQGYAKKYCGAHKKTINGNTFWDMKGSLNMDELHNKLRQSIMIRRQKEDVLDELPEKRRFMIPLELNNRQEYKKAVNNFSEWMEEQGAGEGWEKSEVLVKMEKLKQLAWQGKYDHLVDWIDETLQQTDKLVVFAHHQELQEKLYERYEDRAVHLTGGMGSTERQNVIDEFTENEDVEICITSIKAGGIGINLQVANIAVFTEILWTPSDMSQCEGRVHRIGSESDQVDIYYLMAENTVEESIFKTINEKQEVIDEAIDGITEEKEKGILIDVLEDMNIDKSKDL